MLRPNHTVEHSSNSHSQLSLLSAQIGKKLIYVIFQISAADKSPNYHRINSLDALTRLMTTVCIPV